MYEDKQVAREWWLSLSREKELNYINYNLIFHSVDVNNLKLI
jgi:hypothetical protein